MREAFACRTRRPLVLEVRDELERMILTGAVRPGERLNETILAEKLGVSRGPVREAARSLEREGLVSTVANQGVFVRSLSVEDALELYDLRALAAGYFCAGLAETANAETIKELQTFVDDMQAAIASGHEERYLELNHSFHDLIASASDKVRAQALYKALGKELSLLRQKVVTHDASLRQSNQEHRRIVDAIACGDPERARKAGAEHHANDKKRLLEMLSRDVDTGGATAFVAGSSEQTSIVRM